jgi:hypothetical protein
MAALQVCYRLATVALVTVALPKRIGSPDSSGWDC